MPRPHILASEVSLDEKYHRLLADNGPSLRRLAASYTKTSRWRFGKLSRPSGESHPSEPISFELHITALWRLSLAGDRC